MKKLLIVLSFSVLLVGCDVEKKVEVIEVKGTDELMEEKKMEIAEQEALDKDLKENHPFECTSENAPRVEDSKFGNVLNRCGEVTQFPAYDFDEEGFILYEWSKWNEAEEKHEYMIKMISKQFPFAESDLVDSSFPPGPVMNNGLYFWGAFGSGPGEARIVLIFDPKTTKFVSAEYFAYDDNLGGAFNGSVAAKEFTAENEDYRKMLPAGMTACMLMPFDILPESLSGRDENYKQEERLELYTKNFPNRVPCIDGDGIDINTGELLAPTGYYDLGEGKFVKS